MAKPKPLEANIAPDAKRQASPYQPTGAPGFVVSGGWLQRDEKDASLLGTTRFRTFADILANTTIVAAGVRFFLNLVAKAGWKVEAADDSTEAQDAAEFVESIMGDMVTPWHRIVRRASMFRFYGFSLQEWTAKRRDDGLIGLLDIAPRAQKTVERWDVADDGSVIGVVQRSPQTFEALYLPRQKLVHVVDDALDENPEGLGLFRHIVKAASTLERMELFEKHGFEVDLRGIPVGRAPLQMLAEMVTAGTLSPEQAAALWSPVSEFVSSHIKSPALGVMLDSSVYRATGENQQPSANRLFDVELMRGDGGPHEEVAAAIERLNREIARVLGVEHLLLGADSKGSHALATDKTQSFGLIVESTLTELRETFRKDILEPLWRLNGWDRATMPTFRTETVQYRDIEQITGALRDLAQAGSPIAPGDEVANDVRALLGLRDAPELGELDAMGLPGMDGADPATEPQAPAAGDAPAEGDTLNNTPEEGEEPQ